MTEQVLPASPPPEPDSTGYRDDIGSDGERRDLVATQGSSAGIPCLEMAPGGQEGRSGEVEDADGTPHGPSFRVVGRLAVGERNGARLPTTAYCTRGRGDHRLRPQAL